MAIAGHEVGDVVSVERCSDHDERGTGLLLDLLDDVLDVGAIADDDRPGEVVAEATLTQQPLAAQPAHRDDAAEAERQRDAGSSLRAKSTVKMMHPIAKRPKASAVAFVTRLYSSAPTPTVCELPRVEGGQRGQPDRRERDRADAVRQQVDHRGPSGQQRPVIRAVPTARITITVSEVRSRSR